jgi:hypothetical protein
MYNKLLTINFLHQGIIQNVAPVAAVVAPVVEENKSITIKSPIGTFYRKPSRINLCLWKLVLLLKRRCSLCN